MNDLATPRLLRLRRISALTLATCICFLSSFSASAQSQQPITIASGSFSISGTGTSVHQFTGQPEVWSCVVAVTVTGSPIVTATGQSLSLIVTWTANFTTPGAYVEHCSSSPFSVTQTSNIPLTQSGNTLSGTRVIVLCPPPVSECTTGQITLSTQLQTQALPSGGSSLTGTLTWNEAITWVASDPTVNTSFVNNVSASGQISLSGLPGIVGTWYGSLQDTLYPSYYATEQFVVQTENTDGTVTGGWNWLSGNWATGTPTFPCFRSWQAASIDANGDVSITGGAGDAYTGKLSANGNTISGTFNQPTGSADYGTWTVSRTPLAIELLDGRSFIRGTTLSANPGALSQVGTLVIGVGADGAALVLVRLTTSSPATLNVSLADSDSQCQSGLTDNVTVGGLQNALAPAAAFGPSVNVQTQASASGSYQAYIWYKAPTQYIRAAPCVTADQLRSSRQLTLTATGADASGTPLAAGTNLVVTRLPVILVHGLWSCDLTWENSDLCTSQDTSSLTASTSIQLALNDALQLVNGVFVADYSPTNASYLSTNASVVRQEIGNAVNSYLMQQIAVVKVDVVAHSMGGLLTRIWTEAQVPNCVAGGYNDPINYCAGDVNRLITIGSPMYGSFWADLLSACSTPGIGGSYCPAVRQAMAWLDKPIDLGGVVDMKTTSLALRSMRQNSNVLGPPVHAIVGDVFPSDSPIPGINTCPYPSTICQVITFFHGFGLPTLGQLADSDTVVKTTSEGGGLSASAQSTRSAPTLPVPHFSVGGIPGETSNSAVAKELIRLLNEQTTAIDYAPYFVPSN